MNHVKTLFQRELAAYFATPLAVVFIVIYLALTGVFTFYLGNFYERGQADLQPFFTFHPWLYLLLVPAIAIRLWAEERKSGTIELLLTLPVVYPAVIGLGYDPIWFGVLFAMNIQIYYLSPPFGPACFFLKSVAPREVTLQEIFASVWPFVLMQIAGLLLVLFFPQIALFLPEVLAK